MAVWVLTEYLWLLKLSGQLRSNILLTLEYISWVAEKFRHGAHNEYTGTSTLVYSKRVLNTPFGHRVPEYYLLLKLSSKKYSDTRCI